MAGTRVGVIAAVSAAAALSHHALSSPLAHAQEGQEPAALKLRQVHVFFRHGARTPLHPLPGVPDASWEEKELCRRALPDVERPMRITGLGGSFPPISNANEKQVRPWGSGSGLRVVVFNIRAERAKRKEEEMPPSPAEREQGGVERIRMREIET